MRKVVSIALFGDSERKDGSGQNYHVYLPSFILAHANLFPLREGWELHVHVDEITANGSYGRMLHLLAVNNLIKLVEMGSAGLTKAMLWRMAPVFEPGIDYVFPRDIDACPMPRDRAVCDVFITANCAVHTVHDSLSHAGIMGGLCGFKTEAFKTTTGLQSLDDLYAFAKQTEAEWAQHGTDQLVLNRLIDRNDGPTLLEHRYAGWHAGPNKMRPHSRGEYRTKSWSTPMPDVGKSKVATYAADLLANHLGAAGYDHLAARDFWEKNGNAEIAATVKVCES